MMVRVRTTLVLEILQQMRRHQRTKHCNNIVSYRVHLIKAETSNIKHFAAAASLPPSLVLLGAAFFGPLPK